MARIMNTANSAELVIQNFGEFKATFTATSGITKTLEFEVDENYESVSPPTVGNNTISYDVLPNAGAVKGNIAFSITFDLNVSADTILTNVGTSQMIFGNEVFVMPVSQATNYDEKLIITSPEILLTTNGTPLEATINSTRRTEWEVTVTDTANTVNFNKKN